MKPMVKMTALFWAVAGLGGPAGMVCGAPLESGVHIWHCNVNQTPFQGSNFTQRITIADRATLVHWNPETAVPPVSGREAIQRARQLVENRFPDCQWEFSGLTLKQWDQAEDTWLYSVCFTLAGQEPNSPDFFSITIVVTPDGGIPELRSEPADPDQPNE